MRTAAPPLMAIFRSQLQGELLASVLLDSGQPTITDLARQLDAPVATVHREVERLEAAGLLRTTRVGRSRLVSVDEANPAVEPLRELVRVAFGPRQVVVDCFADTAGVQQLVIFGSWAARYLGEPGPVPGDIDVLVVGSPEREDVFDAAETAARRLRREVNPIVVSAERWAASDELFLKQLRSRPLLQLACDNIAP
jgi:predicted nucleotidyltransferase